MKQYLVCAECGEYVEWGTVNAEPFVQAHRNEDVYDTSHFVMLVGKEELTARSLEDYTEYLGT